MLFGKRINKYYLKYLLVLLIGIIALLLVDIAQLKIPEIYSAIIDGLNGEGTPLTKEILLSFCSNMFLIVAVLVLGRMLWRLCFYGSSIKVVASMRKEMFNHVKDLPQEYYSKNKVGGLMSLFTNDLGTVEECFGDGILFFFDALGLGSLAIYKMFSVNKTLALFSLIPLIILVIMTQVIGRYMDKKWETRQKAFSTLSDFSQESFSGIAVIKAFIKEGKELFYFKKLNKDNENANIEFVKASTLLHVLITLLIQSVLCVIIGYGSYIAYKNDGDFTVGQLIEFMSYFNSCIWPMMAISNLIDLTSRGRASLRRINELLDYKNNVIDKEDVLDIDKIYGDIEFKNVFFKYPNTNDYVLKDISFKIKRGENIGIIGHTGSGKTTIVDLLLRLYNVDDNSIYIDNIDVNKIPIKVVRKDSAYVPQDNFLFSDTIESNIAFAFESVNEEEVKKAAILADVHDNIVEFDKGYRTILGERGVTISGGQKQRTSIARALMKDASILILDDSVSAVDTKTEKSILKNLKENRIGKTTILIAHRISTVQNLDKILFLEEGKVLGFDTHENLYLTNEKYRNMVELQKLEDEKGGNE